MSASKSTTKKIVSRVFADRFKHVRLSDVIVVPDRDSDGDPIEWVTVVFDHPEKISGEKLAEFVTHLYANLPPSAAFPVLSFRSTGDQQGMQAEAA